MTPINGDVGSMFPAVSSEGDRAAIARGNTAEVYSLPGGQLIRAVRHAAAVAAVAFGPSGHDLVSGSIDGAVLFTQDNRDSVAMVKSSGAIDAVALLSDGRVISSDSERNIRVYDSRRATLLAELHAPSRSLLLRPSPRGDRLLTLGTYTSADPPTLWDFDHYRIVGRLEGHVGLVESARFVRDGGTVLTSGADGTVRMWDASLGRLRQTFHGSKRFLADAVLDPSRTVVVAGGGDGLLYFWDVETGRPLWTLKAHNSFVVGIHFEGNDIVTRGFGGDVARWTLPEPAHIIAACGSELATNERVGCTMTR